MANENAASGSPKLFPSLQGQPAVPASTEPSLPKTTPVGLSEESKNVFTELFGKDASQKTGSVMTGVMQQQDKKSVAYFGNKPKEALSLKSFSKHKSNPGATLLQVSVLVFFLTVGYFLTQNSTSFSWFGVNPALRVDTFQSQVSSLSAEVRVQRHLAAALLLDQYLSSADEYLYDVDQANSVYTSQNKKEEFLLGAAEVKPVMLELLTEVQEKLSEDIPDSEVATAVLTADNLITALRAKKGTVDDQALLQDIQDLETAKALLQNQTFRDLVKGVVVAEVSDADIESLFDTYNSLNASSNSIISTIKAARPEWSVVLDDMEAVIKSVDPLFGTEFTGNFTITDVVFNSDGTLTLSGNSSTSDTTNFTLVSNLIDAFESSSSFQNAEDRSYTKNEGEDVYTGSFRITMSLENNPSSND